MCVIFQTFNTTEIIEIKQQQTIKKTSSRNCEARRDQSWNSVM